MTYVIRVEPVKGTDGIKGLKRALKYLGRSCELRCISVDEERFMARPADGVFNLATLPQEGDDEKNQTE